MDEGADYVDAGEGGRQSGPSRGIVLAGVGLLVVVGLLVALGLIGRAVGRQSEAAAIDGAPPTVEAEYVPPTPIFITATPAPSAATTETTNTAPSQADCRYVLGFAAMRDLIGANRVGDCLENEHVEIATGNTLQRTSGGLLVWRKSDGVTAFTDGSQTWLNGPRGLQVRGNGERFEWESDAASFPRPPE